MREVIISLFNYDELSQDAKDVAFDNWQSDASQMPYAFGDEVRSIIAFIKENSSIGLVNWKYDNCGYDYDIEVDVAHADYSQEYLGLTGFRAAKAALAIYYDLVLNKQVFGATFSQSQEESGKFEYTEVKYKKLMKKYRHSVFLKANLSMTGYCSGELFTSRLLRSVKDNTSDSFSLKDHLQVAFNAFFDDILNDMDYLESREYFEENNAYEYEYEEDGSVFE